MKALILRPTVTAVILGATALAAAHAADMATGKPDREHCYGIAKAGENNCAAANGRHSCAGQAKTDYSGQDFKEVAKGTCESMKGTLKPFSGANPKAKD